MTALVEGDDWLHSCAVEDLSIGGALLRGGPPAAVGQVIRVTLHLPGGVALAIEALVVRHTVEEGLDSALAVAFRNLTAQDEDAIQDAILSAVEALNAPSSVLRPRSVGDHAVDRSTSSPPEATFTRSSSWPRK